MLRMVLSKRRRQSPETEDAQELVFYCSTEDELLKLLSGYRGLRNHEVRLDPFELLEELDPGRPNRTIRVAAVNGNIDTVSLHTLQ